MAQKGRIQITVTDTSGNALSGVSVEIRKQGATVRNDHAGANTSFTVNDPGAITTAGTADEVQVGTDSGTTQQVSSFTATNVTVADTFTDVDDNDRLTVINNLPTIYSDANGDQSITNPISTGANGSVTCWAEITPYDVHISGGSATTALREDVVPVGHGDVSVNDISGATAVGYILDTNRSFSDAGAKLISIRNATSEKFSVDKDGDLLSHTVNGALTVASGGLTITAGDLTMSENASQIVPGATSFSIRDTADAEDNIITTDAGVTSLRAGLTLTAGDFTMGATASQIVPGATSFAVRDTADSRNNLLISDAGLTTLFLGLVVTSGGATVTAGGLTITAGNSTFSAPVVNTINVLPANTTPSVAAGNVFTTNSSGSITNFTSGTAGQIITLIGNDGGNTTLLDGGSLALAGNLSPLSDDDTIMLVLEDSVWKEISRSVN